MATPSNPCSAAASDDAIAYGVDARDVLTFVNAAWDDFALGNGGETILSSQVLRRPLWDFVADETTRLLYASLLKQVRRGHAVQFDFRCDAPDCERLLRMDVTPGANQSVGFSTRTLWTRTAKRPMAIERARDDAESELLRSCAWCARIRVGAEWVSLEQALERLRLFERSVVPGISHGICDACLREMEARIDAT